MIIIDFHMKCCIGNLLNDFLKQILEKSELFEKLRRKGNLKGKC